MWELPWHLPALSLWKDPCESSPESTATSLGKYYPETQCGFRPGRGATDMIFSAHQVQEKCREQGRDICLAFIDLTKAFDSVNREALWACLARLGCPPKFVSITRQLHEGMKGRVLYDGDQSGSFNINTGVKQGCVIAPTVFSMFLVAFISLAAVDQAKGVGII